MERNDVGEHKRLVSHQADRNAKNPGKATIMIDISTPLPLVRRLPAPQLFRRTEGHWCSVDKLYDSFFQ